MDSAPQISPCVSYWTISTVYANHLRREDEPLGILGYCADHDTIKSRPGSLILDWSIVKD